MSLIPQMRLAMECRDIKRARRPVCPVLIHQERDDFLEYDDITTSRTRFHKKDIIQLGVKTINLSIATQRE